LFKLSKALVIRSVLDSPHIGIDAAIALIGAAATQMQLGWVGRLERKTLQLICPEAVRGEYPVTLLMEIFP
jgi:hypothetical protein